MTDVVYMTWEHFEEAMRSAIADLSRHARLSYPPTGIYGIPRGGLIVAVTLSHRLSIPWLPEPQPGCILVDDVIETGHTMQTLINDLHKQHPGLHWASWVWISKNLLPEIGYHCYVDPKVWVCFPWSDPLKIEEEKKSYQARIAREVQASEVDDADR